MNSTRKTDAAKVPTAQRKKPGTKPGMRAPRHRSTWEPIPLHIPVPEAPERQREDRSQSSQSSGSGRGVLIIQYGDDEE